MLPPLKFILHSHFLSTIIFVGMTVPGSDGSDYASSSSAFRSSRHRGGVRESGHGRAGRQFTGLYTGPYFDPKMPLNVTAQVGNTALITCTVNQIGRKTVSKTAAT